MRECDCVILDTGGYSIPPQLVLTPLVSAVSILDTVDAAFGILTFYLISHFHVMDALDELYRNLFAGERSAGELCALIDRIGGGQSLCALDPAEAELLRARQHELALVGIVSGRATGYVCADAAAFEAHQQRKNRARVDFHRRLQVELEARLGALLAAPAPVRDALDLGRGLEQLRAFLVEHHVSAAPLLQGLRTALRYQLRTRARVLWILDDAALLNVGHARSLEQAVRALRSLGMWLAPPSALLEGGGLQRTQRCWSLLCGVWTRSQVRSIAAAIEAGAHSTVAPAGRIATTTEGADEAAVLRRDANPMRDWCEVL